MARDSAAPVMEDPWIDGSVSHVIMIMALSPSTLPLIS